MPKLREPESPHGRHLNSEFLAQQNKDVEFWPAWLRGCSQTDRCGAVQIQVRHGQENWSAGVKTAHDWRTGFFATSVAAVSGRQVADRSGQVARTTHFQNTLSAFSALPLSTSVVRGQWSVVSGPWSFDVRC